VGAADVRDMTISFLEEGWAENASDQLPGRLQVLHTAESNICRIHSLGKGSYLESTPDRWYVGFPKKKITLCFLLFSPSDREGVANRKHDLIPESVGGGRRHRGKERAQAFRHGRVRE